LQVGTTVIKLGRQGKPHETKIYLIKTLPPNKPIGAALTTAESDNMIDPDDRFEPFVEDDADEDDQLDVTNHRSKPAVNDSNRPTWSVRWDSTKKKSLDETTIPLNNATITIGPTTGLFIKQSKRSQTEYLAKEKLCMSFVTSQRSLDVVFLDSKDIDLWKSILLRTDCVSLHDYPGDRDAAFEKQRRRERDRIRQSEWEREQRQTRRQKGELSDGEKEDDDDDGAVVDRDKPRARHDGHVDDEGDDIGDDDQDDRRTPRGGSGGRDDDVKEISPNPVIRSKSPATVRLPPADTSKRSTTAPSTTTAASTAATTTTTAKRRGDVDYNNSRRLDRADSAEHLRLEDL